MAPGCPALVPAEGYLTHATASQVISRPFSLPRALPGVEVQRERPPLGAFFSAGMITGTCSSYRWIPMTFPGAQAVPQ